ncbi:peptidase S41 [Clostridium weizhouense]|uniref:Peptidase S41 n=1 Tax=Clostridium weizhouense TaxID=2859781 RepID=A0ABS7APZ3_9CLOT|nr:peptidase S41 [Clostridium weizhouense]MBW6410740.1 peptidase S41 [Clostridium weizhouense]
MRKFIKINFCFVLVFLLLFITGCETQYLGGDRNTKWEKDLNYLQKALPKKHVNLFFRISEEEFNKEINDLKESINTLNDDEIVDGIYKIVASVGEGHTKAYKGFLKKYPLQFYYFDDGIYLINTMDKYKEALNCKLTKINGMDIQSIKNILLPLVSNENEATIKKCIPTYLNVPDVLHGVKIIDNIDSTKFTFENADGKVFDLQIDALETDKNNEEFIVSDEKDDSYPLYMQKRSLNYWYKYLEDEKTLYFKYNQCLPDEEAGDITNFTNEVLNFIDNNPVEKFVIDMRNNSGGTSGYLDPIIDGIKRRNRNNEKKLFVIVGRETFSAPIVDACKLREETNATFVGSPTSGKPNHYGEAKGFELPNSKISIRYSTKKFEISKDEGDALIPDHIIEISMNDYLNKKDPVLDYIFNVAK